MFSFFIKEANKYKYFSQTKQKSKIFHTKTESILTKKHNSHPILFPFLSARFWLRCLFELYNWLPVNLEYFFRWLA